MCSASVCQTDGIVEDIMCRDPEYIPDQWKHMVSDAIAN